MAELDLSISGPQLWGHGEHTMELLIDVPAGAPIGHLILGHPQPLLGGHAGHKLPQFLARAFCAAGWLVLRPNFRGVGRSTGCHAQGLGEADDVLALHAQLDAQRPGQRIALVGFSFGAFVMAHVARTLTDRGTPAWRVCLAGMPSGPVEGQRHYDTPDRLPDALVIHGERDERVPLSAVLDWARPGVQPVVVVPDADHFFNGRLPALRALALAHLRP